MNDGKVWKVLEANSLKYSNKLYFEKSHKEKLLRTMENIIQSVEKLIKKTEGGGLVADRLGSFLLIPQNLL